MLRSLLGSDSAYSTSLASRLNALLIRGDFCAPGIQWSGDYYAARILSRDIYAAGIIYYVNPKKSAVISSVLETLANKRARQVHVRDQPSTLAYTSMALVRS